MPGALAEFLVFSCFPMVTRKVIYSHSLSILSERPLAFSGVSSADLTRSSCLRPASCRAATSSYSEMVSLKGGCALSSSESLSPWSTTYWPRWSLWCAISIIIFTINIFCILQTKELLNDTDWLILWFSRFLLYFKQKLLFRAKNKIFPQIMR